MSSVLTRKTILKYDRNYVVMEILDTFMSSTKNYLKIFSTVVNQHFTYLEHVVYSLSTMYKSFPLVCFEIYTLL